MSSGWPLPNLIIIIQFTLYLLVHSRFHPSYLSYFCLKCYCFSVKCLIEFSIHYAKTTLTTFLIGSIFILTSNLGILISKVYFSFILIIGLVLIHIGAILNGIKLYGKPRWNHHIVRFILSILLVVIYILCWL